MDYQRKKEEGGVGGREKQNCKKKRILIKVPTLIGNMCQMETVAQIQTRIAKLHGNSGLRLSH